MGDTGALFLGGIITAFAFGINQPFVLVFVGIIYIAEILSVVLQVLYFKATGGRRLFKMSPLHHHFEMSGWKETKVVAVFSFVTLLGCVLRVCFYCIDIFGLAVLRQRGNRLSFFNTIERHLG